MTTDEALKLALEALELEDMACRYEKEPTPEHIAKAITAIKQARSAPVQEPVAWRRYEGEEHMTTVGTGNVTLIKENEDGSAIYQFNFPPEAIEALTRLGILTAIQAGIGEAKKLAPEYNPEFTDEIKALAEEAGFVTWNGERWNIDNNVVDWASPYDDELVKFYNLVKAKYERS